MFSSWLNSIKYYVNIKEVQYITEYLSRDIYIYSIVRDGVKFVSYGEYADIYTLLDPDDKNSKMVRVWSNGKWVRKGPWQSKVLKVIEKVKKEVEVDKQRIQNGEIETYNTMVKNYRQEANNE